VYVDGIPSDRGNLSLVNSLVVDNRCSRSVYGSLHVTNSVSSDESCTGQAMPESAIQLGPLDLNGGSTLTHALGSGSVAINASGNCLEDLEIFSDQRRLLRPGGPALACDAGAYEFQGPGPQADLAVTIDASPDPVEVNSEVTITVELSNLGPDPASNIEVLIEWPDDWVIPRGNAMAGPDGNTSWLWEVPVLEFSSTEELTIRVYPTQPGEGEVSVSVSALQTDSNSGNDSAMDTIEITAPDLIFHDRFRNPTPRTP